MSSACSQPIALPDLIDYWFGELPSQATERLELHLLACDACGDQLRSLVALGEGVRLAAHRGAVGMVVTDAFLQTAGRAGLRTREYRVPPGGRVECTVTAEDDLLVGRMQGDFAGVARLDLLLFVEGRPEHRLEDVPVSPDARELILAQAMPAARAMGREVMHVRLVSLEAGSERIVGDYTFDHHPS